MATVCSECHKPGHTDEYGRKTGPCLMDITAFRETLLTLLARRETSFQGEAGQPHTKINHDYTACPHARCLLLARHDIDFDLAKAVPVLLDIIDGVELERDRLRDALKSIATNTCCASCQEAALVARRAIQLRTNNLHGMSWLKGQPHDCCWHPVMAHVLAVLSDRSIPRVCCHCDEQSLYTRGD
jgi:hypothetical protein